MRSFLLINRCHHTYLSDIVPTARRNQSLRGGLERGERLGCRSDLEEIRRSQTGVNLCGRALLLSVSGLHLHAMSVASDITVVMCRQSNVCVADDRSSVEQTLSIMNSSRTNALTNCVWFFVRHDSLGLRSACCSRGRFRLTRRLIEAGRSMRAKSPVIRALQHSPRP